jgi:diadenosine tetraphosphate (Ap4A) HIT family hydrolase
MSCIFCKIASAEIPAKIIFEGESTIAFLDIKPINLGHTLVIPKSHYESLSDIPYELIGKMAEVGKKIAEVMKNTIALKCEGINFHLADGRAAGQEVSHIHLHIIPRFAGDGFGLKIPPHYGQITDKEISFIHSKLISQLGEK